MAGSMRRLPTATRRPEGWMVSPPHHHRRLQRRDVSERKIADEIDKNSPCLSLSARVMGESSPTGTAQPPRRSGGEVPPDAKAGGRWKPWLRPEERPVGARGREERPAPPPPPRGREERGGKRWWPGAGARKPSNGIGGLQPV